MFRGDFHGPVSPLRAWAPAQVTARSLLGHCTCTVTARWMWRHMLEHGAAARSGGGCRPRTVQTRRHRTDTEPSRAEPSRGHALTSHHGERRWAGRVSSSCRTTAGSAPGGVMQVTRGRGAARRRGPLTAHVLLLTPVNSDLDCSAAKTGEGDKRPDTGQPATRVAQPRGRPRETVQCD